MQIHAAAQPEQEDAVAYAPNEEGEVKPIDVISLIATNAMQAATGASSSRGIPVAQGSIDDLQGGPLFLPLYRFFEQCGHVYKLIFGPKSFIVLSSAACAKCVLRSNAFSLDKGVLAEILYPIMGKGLIPADLQTWKSRRRAIVPGFHERWLSYMTESVFGACAENLVLQLHQTKGERVDMEERWNSLALDIIGLSVFNYDFGSVSKESPVIKAVYNTLKEAEHRSTFYVPYWKLPFADKIVPRQRSFQNDLKLINDTLTSLIRQAQQTRDEADVEELKERDYENLSDPSLLRFLVDLRGEEVTNAQLRDDLMTMLVAGHETTASVLTWATYCLALDNEQLSMVQEEVDCILAGKSRPTYEDVKEMKRTRRAIAESLRLYPQPPLLIRRALEDVELPDGREIPKGQDVFLSVYNVHRSSEYWQNPHEFDLTRWDRPSKPSEDVDTSAWQGYDPDGWKGLYPNETSADYAYLPFGGGMLFMRCVMWESNAC